MSPIRVIVVSLVVAFGTSTPTHAECPIHIPTVPIGNLGNAPDPLTGNLYGSVAYAYSIGTYEVTNAQYAVFLNAVAQTDTNALYNTGMAGSFGGITRSGSPGSYTYSTVSGRANHPVNFVSFWDACRFANWLHNGQPNGAQNNSTTEDGAYTLTSGGIAANSVSRNAGWRWAVPTENEWYKAAYHQPASAGGDIDDYWLYPTSANTISTGQANYNNVIGNTVPVDSYGQNFVGTFQMGGNVSEWNSLIVGAARGIRGGPFDDIGGPGGGIGLRSDFRNGATAPAENSGIGFRVAAINPPPQPCLGDLNGDSAVNTVDLTQFLGQFGTTVPAGTQGDLNCDGAVNTADLTIFLGRFGSAC